MRPTSYQCSRESTFYFRPASRATRFAHVCAYACALVVATVCIVVVLAALAALAYLAYTHAHALACALAPAGALACGMLREQPTVVGTRVRPRSRAWARVEASRARAEAICAHVDAARALARELADASARALARAQGALGGSRRASPAPTPGAPRPVFTDVRVRARPVRGRARWADSPALARALARVRDALRG